MNSNLSQIINPVLQAILGSGEGGEALAELMARLFRAVVIVGAIALLLYLAWGGLNWIMAGGDKGKVEQAKGRITNAIIGMAILVSTIAIAMFLSAVFGFDLLNPKLNFNQP
jgi:xanthine/uracil permease